MCATMQPTTFSVLFICCCSTIIVIGTNAENSHNGNPSILTGSAPNRTTNGTQYLNGLLIESSMDCDKSLSEEFVYSVIVVSYYYTKPNSSSQYIILDTSVVLRNGSVDRPVVVISWVSDLALRRIPPNCALTPSSSINGTRRTGMKCVVDQTVRENETAKVSVLKLNASSLSSEMKEELIKGHVRHVVFREMHTCPPSSFNSVNTSMNSSVSDSTSSFSFTMKGNRSKSIDRAQWHYGQLLIVAFFLFIMGCAWYVPTGIRFLKRKGLICCDGRQR